MHSLVGCCGGANVRDIFPAGLPTTKRILCTAGLKAVVPGAATAAIACTLLQCVYNELGIARLKYVSRMGNDAQALSRTPTPPEPLEPPKPAMQRILVALGLHEVSDDEYLAKMKRTRDIYMKRLAVLEQQLEEEKRKKDNP